MKRKMLFFHVVIELWKFTNEFWRNISKDYWGKKPILKDIMNVSLNLLRILKTAPNVKWIMLVEYCCWKKNIKCIKLPKDCGFYFNVGS